MKHTNTNSSNPSNFERYFSSYMCALVSRASPKLVEDLP